MMGDILTLNLLQSTDQSGLIGTLNVDLQC